MRKIYIVLFVLLLSTTIVSATSEPIVTCNSDFSITAGCKLEIPINITYSGDEATITFSADYIEGVNVEYSPNPVTVTSNTLVIMYINTSMLLAPEEYTFNTYYTIVSESGGDDDNGGGSSKTRKISHSSNSYVPPEPVDEEPWYHPEPPEQPPRINVQDPPVYLKGQPEDELPLFAIGGILLFIILGSIIFFVWRKKKKLN